MIYQEKNYVEVVDCDTTPLTADWFIVILVVAAQLLCSHFLFFLQLHISLLTILNNKIYTVIGTK